MSDDQNNATPERTLEELTLSIQRSADFARVYGYQTLFFVGLIVICLVVEAFFRWFK